MNPGVVLPSFHQRLWKFGPRGTPSKRTMDRRAALPPLNLSPRPPGLWYHQAMPQRDSIHDVVRQALAADGWDITDDPYVISYGERFLFVDLGAVEASASDSMESRFIGAQRGSRRIAVEIKKLRGKSVVADLEQAIGQYVLYRLLLNKVDPERELYMAVTDIVHAEIFSEPIGELVIAELPLQLLVVDSKRAKVQTWIPERVGKKS